MLMGFSWRRCFMPRWQVCLWICCLWTCCHSSSGCLRSWLLCQSHQHQRQQRGRPLQLGIEFLCCQDKHVQVCPLHQVTNSIKGLEKAFSSSRVLIQDQSTVSVAFMHRHSCQRCRGLVCTVRSKDQTACELCHHLRTRDPASRRCRAAGQRPGT